MFWHLHMQPPKSYSKLLYNWFILYHLQCYSVKIQMMEVIFVFAEVSPVMTQDHLEKDLFFLLFSPKTRLIKQGEQPCSLWGGLG